MKFNTNEIHGYFINPDKFPQRLPEIKAMVDSLGLASTTRISDNFNDPSRVVKIAKAHIMLIENAISNNKFPFMIFEDDALLMKEFPKSFDIPDEADIVYIGGSIYNCGGIKPNMYIEEYNELYYRVYNMLSSHAMLITNLRGAKLIIDTYKKSIAANEFSDIYLAIESKDHIFLTPKDGMYFYQNDYTEDVTKFLWSDYIQANKAILKIKPKLDKDVMFYNNYHKGDIHYSRDFVKDIRKKLASKYRNFYHANNYIKNNLYFDMEYNISGTRLALLPDNGQVIDKNNNIYINTWIGQCSLKYLTQMCSLHSYYEMYKDIYKTLDISIDPIEEYVPSVDFSKLDMTHRHNITKFIDPYLSNNKARKIVLVCNGDVLSNQSTNFSFEHVLNVVSFANPDCIFICTCKSFTPIYNNVFFSDDIIKKENDDLNEISYLSIFCNVIIGRASGAYTFTHIKENINDSYKTYISFSNSRFEGVYYQGAAKNVWSNNYNIKSIIDIINTEMA